MAKRKIEVLLSDYLTGNYDPKSFHAATDDTLYNELVRLGVKNQSFHILMEELLINAQEHGDGKPRLRIEKQNDDYFFMLVDRGVGIHEKVPENPRLSDTKGKSSQSIIRLALEEGITGTGIIGRGMGLYFLSTYITRNSDSVALLASDKGCVIQEANLFYDMPLELDTNSNVVIVQTTKKALGI